MAVSVKNITLWRKEVPNRAGELARVLRPLADAGANLQVLMSYAYPGEVSRAAVEIYPVSGKKPTAAAQSGGVSAASMPTLLVEVDNRPGLGYDMARAIADQGVNISFLVAQVVGRKCSAVFGFESVDDARKAASAIKKAAASRRRA